MSVEKWIDAATLEGLKTTSTTTRVAFVLSEKAIDR